ncbi:MAG: hypothetical protein GOMPHAMPRED_003553 [Gomphillus americanus]|uniref:Uncharacterized protein n=1 Tax=Gomphillus americanus TaxID=1940652 RepID=A0A8H3FK10_9LECA|nr:MAG: hypothetical protein GOMPHAMPRED_003553 [Gomphillus americanus]
MKFDLYLLFLIVGPFKLAFGHGMEARSLLPRTQGSSRSHTTPRARPSIRKDVINQPLPELKRVNSAPSQTPDPKALALMEAEKDAKNVRKDTRQREAMAVSQIDRRISRHSLLPTVRDGGARLRHHDAGQIRDMQIRLGEQRLKLGQAYVKARKAAAVASRQDRFTRNTRKARAAAAHAQIASYQSGVTDAHANSEYLPSAVRSAQARGGPSRPTADELNRMTGQAREELRHGKLMVEKASAQYQQMRAAGGKDTDSE